MDKSATTLHVPLHLVSPLGTAVAFLVTAANGKNQEDFEQAARMIQQAYVSPNKPFGNEWRRIVHLALLIAATEIVNQMPQTFDLGALIAAADRILVSPWTHGSMSVLEFEGARDRLVEVSTSTTT